MLQFPAKTLRNRLQELSELPGLDEVTAKSLILRRPELLRLSMRTVAANISALAALLGVVPAVIPHIVRFHPRLLFLSTLRSNIETTSGLLAIAQARFIAAALRQPQLLFQKPASVLARVERIGDLFNISAEEVLVLAHRQPHLLTRSPDTLIANARLAARLLRIPYAAFRLIVLKAPSLLCRKPESLKRNPPYIRRIGQALGLTKSLAQLLHQYPNALTYSADRLLLRYLAALFQLFDCGFNKLITMPPSPSKRSSSVIRRKTAASRFFARSSYVGLLPLTIPPIRCINANGREPAQGRDGNQRKDEAQGTNIFIILAPRECGLNTG
jgi:hypothetical protein